MSNNNFPDNNFLKCLKRVFGKKNQTVLGIVIAIPIFIGLYMFWTPSRPLKPFLNSRPFVWPRGCPSINYQYAHSRGDNIACACKNESNRIFDWKERGLHNSNKVLDQWYRVGDYAINIRKNNGFSGNRFCSIVHVQNNFFQYNIKDKNK